MAGGRCIRGVFRGGLSPPPLWVKSMVFRVFLALTGAYPPPLKRKIRLSPPGQIPKYAPGGYPYDPAVNVSLVSVNRSVARTGGSLKVQVSVWRNTGYYNLLVHINTSINSCKIDNILIKPPSLLRP